jgi:AP-1-like transcription factor
MSTNGSRSYSSSLPKQGHHFGHAVIQNLSDVNFQFEFPKFGALSGCHISTGRDGARAGSYPSPTSSINAHSQTHGQTSPSESHATDKTTPASSNGIDLETQPKDTLSKYSGLFNSPSPYDNAQGNNASRSSLDSTSFSLNGANSASPCSSTISNMGPSSSCGTSPEPSTQSPLGFKPVDTLTTIGEEQPSLTDSNLNGMTGKY